MQIEHAECQVEHANAVMTLMGHRSMPTDSYVVTVGGNCKPVFA